MFLGMFLSLDLLGGLDFSGSFVHSRRSSCFTFSRFFFMVRDFFFIVAFYLCVPEGREITGTYFARYLGWGEGGAGGVVLILYPVFGFVSFLCLGAVISLTISSGSSDATFCLSSPLYSVYFSTSFLSSLLWRSLRRYVCVCGGGKGEVFFFIFFFHFFFNSFPFYY